MILLRPHAVGPSELTASNVAITETEWTPGTYNRKTQRYVGTTIYEVVAEPSTDDEPTAGAAKTPATWIKVGPINRHKMFAAQISDPTTNAGSIDVTIDIDGTVNGAAFFGVAGTQIDITLTDATEGVVYAETIALQNFEEVTDWHGYYFSDISYRRQVVDLALPSYRNATLRAIISSDTTAECGLISLGKQRIIGETTFGVEAGIIDFSTKETNAFGHFDVIQRGYSRRVDYPVKVLTGQVDSVLSTLAEYRATPAVYVGDPDRPGTVSIGYWRDFQIVYSAPVMSDLNIEIEGLV